MSKQWGHGFNTGVVEGMRTGEWIGEAKTQMDLGMKALCLATAIRAAQKEDTVAQYVLTEVLIDILAEQTGGRIGQAPEPEPS